MQNKDLEIGILGLDVHFSNHYCFQGFLFANQSGSKNHKANFNTLTSIFFWFCLLKYLGQNSVDLFFEAFQSYSF